MDYATTTPLDPAVEKEMRRFWSKDFGNPSSLHSEGAKASQALESARKRVGRVLLCRPSEILFTASGTEANNMALLGFVAALEKEGRALNTMHLMVSAIEHSSVRECALELQRRGVKVDFVPVDAEGIVKIAELQKLITDETVLISVMLANNEIGTVQPIRKISAHLRTINEGRARDKKIFLHTDACQTPLYLRVDQNRLGADLISLDGHKIYGPRGVGALYVRSGTPMAPILFGGHQERGLRPGTESVALISGFALALELAEKRREAEVSRLTPIRNYFFDQLRLILPEAIINGSVSERLPNNINFSLLGINVEFAVVQLDAKGIAAATKSACLENEGVSYVIEALHGPAGAQNSSLRFSLGRSSRKADVAAVLKALRDLKNHHFFN